MTYKLQRKHYWQLGIQVQMQLELEACIDDERQFKIAKRSQAPGDATVLKGFSSITSLLFVVDRKE